MLLNNVLQVFGQGVQTAFTVNATAAISAGGIIKNANIILQFGVPVNILKADTRHVGGTAKGEMILGLPKGEELQKQILANQARYVKPGGTLLYSTCTVLKRENEDVVAAFLETHSDFYLEPLDLPEEFPENTSGMLTLIPGQHDTDGFFICRLRRKA